MEEAPGQAGSLKSYWTANLEQVSVPQKEEEEEEKKLPKNKPANPKKTKKDAELGAAGGKKIRRTQLPWT